MAEDFSVSSACIVDLPAPTAPLPAWISGVQERMSVACPSAEIGILPPQGHGDLAVTLYFEDVKGGFLRVMWEGTGAAEMLQENLMEGLDLPSHRTFLIPRSSLLLPGKLVIQTGESRLNVFKAALEWVTEQTVAVAGEAKVPALLREPSLLLRDSDVGGIRTHLPEDEWKGMVITAPLIEKVERIEGGVLFGGTLESVPDQARLTVKISGLPLETIVEVRINEAFAGFLSVETPDLTDPAFIRTKSGDRYAGWRAGTFWIPVSLLRMGENTVELKEASSNGFQEPVAVKEMNLQLKYSKENRSVGE